MLIIGRRGAAGLAPENTLEACSLGLESGAHALHIDVRVTLDGIPVLLHDSNLKRTHKLDQYVHNLTYEQLTQLTSQQPVDKLERLLDDLLQTTILFIEPRDRQAAKAVANLLKARKLTANQWRTVIVASFRIKDLFSVRAITPQAPLALLHDNNPFTFIAYHRTMKFTAVGFHRLHTNKLAQQIAKRAGIFTFLYTINRPKAAVLASENSYDGVMTYFPDRLAKAIEEAS